MMVEILQRRSTARVAVSVSRWTQLALDMRCMARAANLQYGWTLFVNPMLQKMGWSLAAIQVAFTLFVLASALVFFAWGESFSMFPATVADTFGTGYAATNCGLLYTAKGVAAFLVPLARLAMQQGGHWDTVLVGSTWPPGWWRKGRCSRCASAGCCGRAEADCGPGSYRLPCKNMKDQIAATGAAARSGWPGASPAWPLLPTSHGRTTTTHDQALPF